MDEHKYNVHKSPFLVLDTPFTAWEAFKLVLLLPLVPFRILLIILATVVLAIVNSTMTIGCDMSKPLPKWRRAVIEANSKFGCWVILKSVGMWMSIKGYENFEESRKMGCIIVFNHVSYCDAFAIVRFFAASGVSLASNERIPILGRAVMALQNILVEPERKPGSAPADGKPVKRVTELITERANSPAMPPLAIAPEGTCGSGQVILQFKTGAFVAGKPVLPVIFRYSMKRHNPAWTIISEFWHLVRLCCQFVTFLDMEVLPPYMPSEAEAKDPLLYAANMRKLYAERMGLPYCEQDRSDMVALIKAGVGVSWDGRRVVAPPGVLDPQGLVDLSKYKAAKKTS